MPEIKKPVAAKFNSITGRISRRLYPRTDEPAPDYALLANEFDAQASAARSDGNSDDAELWEDGAEEARRLLLESS